MDIRFYRAASGKMPVLEYLSSIPKEERAMIYVIFDRIKKQELFKSIADFRHIEGKLWEIKVSSHRVFYVIVEKDLMVLLHAYKKQGQKLPSKDRNLAMERMKKILS